MKIKITCFAVMLFLSFIISYSGFAFCVLLAVLIHELGHIFTARYLNISLSECKIDIFGASLCPAAYNFSYKDEILLCISGPMSNLLTLLPFIPFALVFKHDLSICFATASLALALLNLLPISGFDGGRIFYALVCILSDPDTANTVISVVSFFCILVLWLISVYLLLIARSNLSLFVFSISLFIKIFIKEN